MHSLDGILQPDRQLREHRRDLVVIAPGRIIGADRHGHERAENASLDGLAATEQQIPEATGDHGEHDIVDPSVELPPSQPPAPFLMIAAWPWPPPTHRVAIPRWA